MIQLNSAKARVHSAICFHCQQMAEKYLKALVHERDLVVPRTHDCRKLVLLLAETDPSLTEYNRVAFGLSRYAVGSRYPDLFVEVDASHSRAASKAAERIRAEARRRLGLRQRP